MLEMKPGTDPNLVMAYLYKHTELQKNFSYNMTAWCPAPDGTTMVPQGRPEPQGRCSGTSSTSASRPCAALRVRAASNCAGAFTSSKASRSSSTPSTGPSRSSARASGKPDAAEKLKKAFKLDDEQANAILDAQLYKIAQMEIKKILDELKEKKAQAERDRGDPGVEEEAVGRRQGRAGGAGREVRRPAPDADGLRRGRARVRSRRRTSSARTPTSC